MTWDIRQMIGAGPDQKRDLESFEFTPLGEAVAAVQGLRTSVWRAASIKEALGVPAIQRAVSLIANTTGSLSVEGLRNGVPMDEPPRIVQRPDPFTTPRDFYRDTAYYLATRGEFVWWIAARDFDGLPASLIVVPARELVIEANPRDRRFPIYRWGNGTSRIVSTRYSPIANQTGEFVHGTYLKEPGDLRGQGPMQFCGAAISVTVEAQEWAANFFAGGSSTTELASQVDIDEAEATALKEQWMETTAGNLPRVTTPTLKWIDHTIDPKSAQMVESRTKQDGEAAQMFGIPGALLEYNAAGSSLTYQNVAEVFTNFVRTCLTINYLEPIEQAMSDLLPRTTAARFAVAGLLRADIKTRFEVYEKAALIWPAEEAAEYARQGEGIVPGNIEAMPVPFAFPASVPSRIPERSQQQRSEELATTQARSGERFSEAMMMIATREQPTPVVNVHPAEVTVNPAPITFERGAVQVDAPDMRPMSEAIAGLIDRPAPNVQVDVAAPDMSGVAEALSNLADRPQPDITVNTPEVHVEPATVTFEEGSIRAPDVIVEPAQVTVNVPVQAPPQVDVHVPEPRATRKKIKRDADNNITEITEEPV